MILTELRQATGTLRGVGEKRAHLLHRIGIETVADLLQHYPRTYEDRATIVHVAEAPRFTACAVRVSVVAHDFFIARGKRTLKVVIGDESGRAALLCFGRNFLSRTFRVGREFFVWGYFDLRRGEVQASRFEAEPTERAHGFGRIVPVYGLTEGLGQQAVRGAVESAVERFASTLADELPASTVESHGLKDKRTALGHVHRPPSMDAVVPARRRLAFEELFLFQLRVIQLAAERRARSTVAVSGRTGGPELLHPFRGSLPFRLTDDQERVIDETVADMERPGQMVRLLQGDVGSGKTLVAVCAALAAIERGRQVAFMAPTEILARQHARSIGRLLRDLPVTMALVLGSMPAGQRREARRSLHAGETNLIVGTHALFSSDIAYARLGLAVIDEQHRFGVAQREALTAKGLYPDVLLMSATPIPRTLALTVFGESDVSTISTMPPGRTPVRTHITRQDAVEDVYRFVERELERGRQAFFVYPRIDTSGDSRAAVDMHRVLQERFPSHPVGLVHGRMADDEVDAAMAAFGNGATSVLVATTVVEVGVDVPNATCMVVDHAERFGLAALHQLRGRVGRGSHGSYCFLVYDPELSDPAKERLRIVFETSDGFALAERDLDLRGPGDLTGLRQAGLPRFRIADLRRDMDLMRETREAARRVHEADPALLLPEHTTLRSAIERARQEDASIADHRR